jgi:hypothetical protein
MPTYQRTLPGGSTLGTIVPRVIFNQAGANTIEFAPTVGIIDGTLSRDVGSNDLGGAQLGTVTYTPSLLRAGLMLGIETTSKQLRNSVIGLTHGAVAAAATTITVASQVATEVARLITVAGGNVSLTIIGPTTTSGPIGANTETLTVTAASGTTLTVTATAHAYVIGSLIQPADGSQIPVTFLTEQYGIDVTDQNGNSLNQALTPAFLIRADLLAPLIPCMTSDDFSQTTEPSCTQYLQTQLRAKGNVFTYSSDRV